MNNNFILLDKNNNLKNARLIVKFNYDDKNYIIYSVAENENNSQIFVSKLILNSEGKYFIDEISAEEKGKLSNIVYNIVILLPSDFEKGNDFQLLINNLFNKFSVKVLSGLPELANQEYYSNCSIAITNNILVENAVRVYNNNLNVIKEDKVDEIPMWTAPAMVTAPTPIEDSNVTPNQEPTIVSVPVEETVVSSSISNGNTGVVSNNSVSVPDVEISSLVVEESPLPVISEDNSTNDVVLPNPQIEKIAIVSDPSLGIGLAQPNVMKNKKAGFANTKYVVIGSVCLVLAIAVIVAAYFLIKNLG